MSSTPAWLSEKPDGVYLRVRLKPRASKDGIEGPAGGELSVRLTAPPVDNKANTALVELIARSLRLPKSSVEITSGEKSRSKTLRILGMKVEEIEKKLRGQF